jgi:hypothetical protein
MYAYAYALCYRVKNTLFRVHRHYLNTYSGIFASMFLLPQAPDPLMPITAEAGDSEGEVVYISDVTVSEFENLLSVFYTRYVLYLLTFTCSSFFN